MVGVIPVAGILIYLMLRPRETLSEQYIRALEEEALLASIEQQEFCPTCGRRVDADMRFCPSCHTRLRKACPSCGRAVHLAWDLCPYCGQELVPELPSVTVSKPVPQAIPAARTGNAREWLANRVRPQPKAQLEEESAASSETSPSLPSASEQRGGAANGVGESRLGRLGSVLGRLRGQAETSAPAEPPIPPATPRDGSPRPARKPLLSRDELE
ncbi:MAG: zinc ribbon domain-containing protein [Thermoflexales bacterium]|nr:zinc ribbon domain-containing protein [Thermoflexales bacterium]